jgi:CDP-diacylglycerol--serine O-phosphatidyltransferase
MVSRVPTLSLKTARVRPRWIAPLLVLVGLAAALLLTAPFLGMAVIALGYLLLIPYTVYRWMWLARHPEAWGLPIRQRRAVARAARSARRLGLRPPLRRRVAGRAGAVARGMAGMGRRRNGEEDEGLQHGPARPTRSLGPLGPSRRIPSRDRRRLGLRRR